MSTNWVIIRNFQQFSENPFYRIIIIITHSKLEGKSQLKCYLLNK